MKECTVDGFRLLYIVKKVKKNSSNARYILIMSSDRETFPAFFCELVEVFKHLADVTISPFQEYEEPVYSYSTYPGRR